MFTGLIEEVGEVVSVEPVDDSLRLVIAGPTVTSDADHGASIAVSGVCLTVIDRAVAADGRATFTADVMAQTIAMSTIGDAAPGTRVNLERAVRVDTRLGGHIVQGHVDGTATLVSVTPHEAWRVLRFSLDRQLAPLLVDKGSVTLSGVSLTVSAISPESEADQWFEVSLIPETLVATTLGDLTPGDRVNVETDILARHVARMLRLGAADASNAGTGDADADADATAHPNAEGHRA
ncbi:riboflavin synthase [Leucobacter sp. USCH14]|uniref:riboflavin synthase n=1 Tax=Leucobacter sp. USCH14 TaxID=3024838 RepID=UPI0030A8C13B